MPIHWGESSIIFIKINHPNSQVAFYSSLTIRMILIIYTKCNGLRNSIKADLQNVPIFSLFNLSFK